MADKAWSLDRGGRGPGRHDQGRRIGLGQAEDRGVRSREAGPHRLGQGRHRRRQQVPPGQGGSDRSARDRQHRGARRADRPAQAGPRSPRPGRRGNRRSARSPLALARATATCSRPRSRPSGCGPRLARSPTPWKKSGAVTAPPATSSPGSMARPSGTVKSGSKSEGRGGRLRRRGRPPAADDGGQARPGRPRPRRQGRRHGARRSRIRHRHRPALPDAPRRPPAQAIENDCHAIGVSTLAAGHKTLVPELVKALKRPGSKRHRVFVGGVIPAQDYEFLRRAGVAGIFGPGTPILVSAKQVLEAIKSTLVSA